MSQTICIIFVRFVMSFALIFTYSSFATAGPIEDVQAAYKAEQREDFELALKLYERAAAGGDMYAMNNIGDMYYNGRGVKRSWVEAIKWYRQAAQKGNADSQHAIGVMYERGESVRPDAAEAVRWYLRSANKGLLRSQNSLGVIYATGAKGVKQDAVRAYLWFSVAAKEDKAAASRRDRAAMKLSPEQLVQADKVVANWKPKK
ncbi:MAG: hypothetical protein CMG46_09110 [Candidatus Marinimicrobia bacterium]|nr:hypothetical protein [Candidatus Neomarinimicrobiota bacterium]